MPLEYDVVVLGEGPAGLATALALTKQAPMLDILVVDASAKRQFKVGETVPPAITGILNQLIDDKASVLLAKHQICPGSISIWQDEKQGYNDFFFDLSGSGYHLDRMQFEQALQNMLKNNQQVRFLRGVQLASATERQDGFSIKICQNKQPCIELESQYIVDATGLSAQFCRHIGVANNVVDEVIYLCALIPNNCIETVTDRTLVEAQNYGWWYAAKLPNQQIMISLCTDRENMQRFNLSVAHVWLDLAKGNALFKQYLQQVLAHLTANHITLLKRPAPSRILSNVIGHHWLAVGDSASSYDPISSAGICKALHHGTLAGQALAKRWMEKDTTWLHRYQHTVFADFNQYVGLRSSLYGKVDRFMNSTFWKNRLTQL